MIEWVSHYFIYPGIRIETHVRTPPLPWIKLDGHYIIIILTDSIDRQCLPLYLFIVLSVIYLLRWTIYQPFSIMVIKISNFCIGATHTQYLCGPSWQQYRRVKTKIYLKSKDMKNIFKKHILSPSKWLFSPLA